jgi:hypothetical protein
MDETIDVGGASVRCVSDTPPGDRGQGIYARTQASGSSMPGSMDRSGGKRQS